MGACIGEAVAGKKLGKKAMLFGALAQSLPDIDAVASFWLDTSSDLLAHRGFTHSILFAVLSTVILGLAAQRVYRRKNIAALTWLLLFGINIFTHLFIDAFNAYGTAWFEPFSHRRISFNTLFVADLLFTIWPLAAFIALLVLKNSSNKRGIWWKAGIGLSVLYLAYSIINKMNVDADVKQSLSQQGIHYEKYLSTPTPLNNWLWFVAAGDSAGFYIGHRSVFDSDEQMEFHYFPRKDSLLKPVQESREVQNLKRFSQGFYTAEKWGDTLVFNDLRFGQMIGWYNPQERFVFHYFLQDYGENDLVVQRGRFAKWNEETIKAMIREIKGN